MTKTERTEERRNRFNGESVMLTKEEAIKHDQIFMAEMMAELHSDPDTKDKHYGIMRKHLDWFWCWGCCIWIILI